MLVFLGAVLMVLLAEMGDKTQLLAMAMAARFSARSVLTGVFLATVLNHALAVAVGNYLGTSLNLDVIQVITSGSFILFGLWTIRGDGLQGEERRKSLWSPVLTVSIAFFFAEMGDKTQFASIALAAKYNSPLAVLTGTTAGMLIADALGIYVGVVAGKKMPERIVKWTSAMLFIAFGYIGLYASVPGDCLAVPHIAGLVGATAMAIYIIALKNAPERSQEKP